MLISYNNEFTRFVTVAADSGEVIERSATTGEETQRFDIDSRNSGQFELYGGWWHYCSGNIGREYRLPDIRELVYFNRR